MGPVGKAIGKAIAKSGATTNPDRRPNVTKQNKKIDRFGQQGLTTVLAVSFSKKAHPIRQGEPYRVAQTVHVNRDQCKLVR